MNSSAKKLNEMNRLGDMGHFPALVNAGATLNVMATICITWWLVPRYPQVFAPVLWVAAVLFFNLLPVALLRTRLRPDTGYRPLGEMDFSPTSTSFRTGCTSRPQPIWPSGCCLRGPCFRWRIRRLPSQALSA